jgi:hypothetical protein
MPDRTPCKPLRAESVTYVFGMNRNPCVRAGHIGDWRATNDDDEQYIYAIAL